MCIVPLLCLGREQWLDINNYKEWSRSVRPQILRLVERKPLLLPRHFLRLEDEVNELGVLYLRRVIVTQSVSIVTGAFILIAVAMAVIAGASISPHGVIADFVVLNICAAVIVFAILELLVILSFVRQEALNEADVEFGAESEG